MVLAAMAHQLPEWYPRRPSSPDEWRARAREVQAATRHWLAPLAPAFDAGGEARDRLERVQAAGGVVVTTGQQPGLFGGPLYTLSKALGALELANAIEEATGIPTAPVFWAATDDADFAESSSTWLRLDGGAERVALDQVPSEGVPLSEVAIRGVSGALVRLTRAAGSAPNLEVLEVVHAAYVAGATVGGAYLTLMRHILEPLGIGVIDASHAALVAREAPTMLKALRRGGDVSRALVDREGEIRARGYEPQVALVDGLTLVFTRVAGKKVRVPASEALGVAAQAAAHVLTPNVLLRPVAERAVLPTVAYVAGPGELAYFAQVSAVAAELGVAAPLAVPRWSCTLFEPWVGKTLDRLGIGWRDLAAEHAVERQLALVSLPATLVGALGDMRASALARAEAFKQQVVDTGNIIDPRVVDGTARAMTWRVDRLERRLIAAAKKREHRALHQVARARGALFPGGKRQERALNFIPFLAAYGDGLVDRMRASARRHAEALVYGTTLPVDA